MTMNLGQLIAALVDIQGKIGPHAKVRVIIEKEDTYLDFAATAVVYDDKAVSISHHIPNKKDLH